MVFGGTDDEPLKHLGEAQTCYVIKNWASFAGSWWISDDREAVADGDISAVDAFDLMNQMADSDRYLRLPRSAADLRR